MVATPILGLISQRDGRKEDLDGPGKMVCEETLCGYEEVGDAVVNYR